MAAEGSAGDLLKLVSLLGAAVVAVPLFKRLGLGSVLGYLAAGLAIGPFGLALFSDPQAILHVAELGVVMFLFVIGLEMRPSHLWSLRRAIFGLGSLQVAACTTLLTALGWAWGLAPAAAFVAAAGFVLTSTAIVMQLLGERGDIATARGQKIVAVLLFEDLLIVPLLALVVLLAPAGAEPGAAAAGGSRWTALALGLGALAALVAAGLWLLNPLFRLLARAKAREVMTAAALLVVLGAALLMQLGGLSMAMGAFLAGVLLSESSFRHQLEADIEPFRGLLLGLFFLGVGMSLDLGLVAASWLQIGLAVLAMMALKSLAIYGVARLTRSPGREALDRAVLMAQGGEFAFVLYAAALGAGVIDARLNAQLTAVVVLSMALTPLSVLALRRWGPRARPSLEGVEVPENLAACVLIIGFGRFGQVASQSVLARGADITIIDRDPEVIRNSADYGFKVYYGDGARADVLHAAGAGEARAILVCVDDGAQATQIAMLVRREFPQAKLLLRAFDREHAVALRKAVDVDYLVRETFESALQLGREAALATGATVEQADELTAEVRRRDAERLALEVVGGPFAGRALIVGNLAGRKAAD